MRAVTLLLVAALAAAGLCSQAQAKKHHEEVHINKLTGKPKNPLDDPTSAESINKAANAMKIELRNNDKIRKMEGAKLYFKLKGMWNETADLDRPLEADSPNAPQHGAAKHGAGRKDCPIASYPRGCISLEKFVSFLEDKWIPGFEATADTRFVEAGHFFKGRGAKVPEQKDRKGRVVPGTGGKGPINVGADLLMHEFTLYLLSRPMRSVPDQVRPYFNQPNMPWPGSQGSSREPFLPPVDSRKDICTPSELKDAPDVCVPWKEQDIETAPQPVKSEAEILQEEHEEEGELANSAIFRQVFYLAMALMGMLVPASIGYFCVRSYLTAKTAFKPAYPLTQNRPRPEEVGNQSQSRMEDLRRQLHATNQPRAPGGFPGGPGGFMPQMGAAPAGLANPNLGGGFMPQQPPGHHHPTAGGYKYAT